MPTNWGREIAALGHEVRLVPPDLREAVRQAAEERRGGRGGDHGSVRHTVRRGEITDPWLAAMLERKPKKVVAVALCQPDGTEGLGDGHEKGALSGSSRRLTNQRKERSEREEAAGRCEQQDARNGVRANSQVRRGSEKPASSRLPPTQLANQACPSGGVHIRCGLCHRIGQETCSAGC